MQADLVNREEEPFTLLIKYDSFLRIITRNTLMRASLDPVRHLIFISKKKSEGQKKKPRVLKQQNPVIISHRVNTGQLM